MSKYIINYLLYIFVLLVLNSCGAGVGDTADKLSGGYTYLTDGGLAYILSGNAFKEGIYPSVTDYSFNSNFILVSQRPSKEQYVGFLSSYLKFKYSILIEADSTNPEYHSGQFEFYRDYFKANRDLYDILHAKGMSTENNIQDRQIGEFVADSLIENDPYYQDIFSRDLNYWIISHKERNEADYLPMSKFYGPYSKEEYLNKRVEIGVPYDLKLIVEDERKCLL